MSNKNVSLENCPFGQKKYVMPSVKKVLNYEQLRLLLTFEAPPLYQNKARDFFFFSFAKFGMNMKDIALLR